MDASSTLHRIEPIDEAREPHGPSHWHCAKCGQPDPRDVKALTAEYARVYRTWSLIRCADRAYIAAAKGAKR